MKKSAVVLLSSGLDSSVNLYKAISELNVLRALTFNYGQRAAKKEIAQSRELCGLLGIEHQVIEIPWLKDITKTSLVNTGEDVPVGASVSIDNFKTSMETAKAVWVPNRNGVFLNIAAAVAEGLGAEYVIPGFNAEEATTFPDNSVAYLKALDHSFSFSTATGVKTLCYTAEMDKTQIVAMGRKLQVPFEKLWPCYFSGDTWCGQCESCQRFQRAVQA